MPETMQGGNLLYFTPKWKFDVNLLTFRPLEVHVTYFLQQNINTDFI